MEESEMGYDDANIVTNTKFLKIEPGDPHDLRLLDENPSESYKHNSGPNGKLDRPVDCLGEETCAYCQDGHDPNQRFTANVYDHNRNKVMLWEYGPAIAKQLKAIAIALKEEQKNILQFDLKVSAEGSGLQKKTTVTMRTTSKAIPADLKLIQIKGEGIPF
jgi:hypothetical protein